MQHFCPRCGTPLAAIRASTSLPAACPSCGIPIDRPPDFSATADELAPEADEIAVEQRTAHDRGEPWSLGTDYRNLTMPAPRKRRRVRKPAWQWMLGDFSFPWFYCPTRWILIGLALTVALPVYMFLVYALCDPLGHVLAIIIMIPATGVTVVLGAILNLHAQTIIYETAAGVDRMEGWPPLLSTEWMTSIWYLINPITLCVLLALGIHLVVGQAWPLPCVIGGVIYLLFPFFLLSVLETESALLPISLPLLAGVRRHLLAWLGFYAQTAVLAALAVAILQCTMPLLGFYFGIVDLSAVAATTILIYFRLIGRLAYYCSVDEQMIGERPTDSESYYRDSGPSANYLES